MQLHNYSIARLEIETEPPGPEHLPGRHLDMLGGDPHGNPFEMGGNGIYLAIQNAATEPKLKQMIQYRFSFVCIRHAMAKDGVILKRPGNHCRSRFDMSFFDAKEIF